MTKPKKRTKPKRRRAAQKRRPATRKKPTLKARQRKMSSHNRRTSEVAAHNRARDVQQYGSIYNGRRGYWTIRNHGDKGKCDLSFFYY